MLFLKCTVPLKSKRRTFVTFPHSLLSNKSLKIASIAKRFYRFSKHKLLLLSPFSVSFNSFPQNFVFFLKENASPYHFFSALFLQNSSKIAFVSNFQVSFTHYVYNKAVGVEIIVADSPMDSLIHQIHGKARGRTWSITA